MRRGLSSKYFDHVFIYYYYYCRKSGGNSTRNAVVILRFRLMYDEQQGNRDQRSLWGQVLVLAPPLP